MNHKPLSIEYLKNRGFFYQSTNEKALDDILQSDKKLCFYYGIDCTSDSLHIGHLTQIMLLRLLLKNGHKIIILLGGATSLIGDPSGKIKTRPILSEEQVSINITKIQSLIKNLFTTNKSNQENLLILNNSTWLKNLNYMDFLREIGQFFSINKLLSLDVIKNRLQQHDNLNFLEFNYILIQAYDFIYLYKKHNCRVQIGGSDQWGNIINGVELSHRIQTKEEIFGITTPLITTKDGKKMGKTEVNPIFLDPKKLSPYDYWMFWRNMPDNNLEKNLKIFTELEDLQINEILEYPDINKAKIKAATIITEVCHGNDEAKQAEKKAMLLFQSNSLSSPAELDVFDYIISYKQENHSLSIINFLTRVNIENTLPLLKSKKETKRLIDAKAIKINDQVIDTPNFDIFSLKNKLPSSYILKIGSKRFIIKITE